MTDRIKFAYLTYDDMLSKLELGDLNEYDIIYSKDKYVTYLITEELKPLQLRSRVYVFDSISDAEIKLNESTDTYIGQVVAILDKDTYRGYIVNHKSEKFTVTPLWEHSEPIDYDSLGNRPIINLIGTMDQPIMVSELDSGIYNVKGQYKISNLEETIYLSASNVIITVERDATETKVKRITSDDITDYIITSSTISKNEYVTQQFLIDNNYATNSYVDSKIEVLEISIKSDIQSYVKKMFDEVLGEELDKRIDQRIEENIQPSTEEEIKDLFK